MALSDALINDVSSSLSNNWNVRDGQVVPFSDQVTLAGGAVRLEAPMLYADLADSTELAMAVSKFRRRWRNVWQWLFVFVSQSPRSPSSRLT
ncbi:MAG TPA: hypothetical protein VI958_12370 [Acidobacteriota bacterium]